MMFGANQELLVHAKRYLLPVKFAVPSFLFTQFVSAFFRNDGQPSLATKAVVFVMDLGVLGVGIAIVLGSLFC